MNIVIKKAVILFGGQKQMAEAIDVSQSAVHKWLHNKIKVSPEKVVKIVEASNREILGHELRPDLPKLFPKPTEEDLIICQTQIHAKET